MSFLEVKKFGTYNEVGQYLLLPVLSTKINNMKKNVLFCLALCFVLAAQSCMDDGCSFKGKWSVQSADVQSTKLSASILQMTKDDYLNSTYEFAKDGKITITGVPGSTTKEGNWTFDENTQELKWASSEGASTPFSETFQMESCVNGEMTLTQRIPPDPAAEAMAEIKITIKKVK